MPVPLPFFGLSAPALHRTRTARHGTDTALTPTDLRFSRFHPELLPLLLLLLHHLFPLLSSAPTDVFHLLFLASSQLWPLSCSDHNTSRPYSIALHQSVLSVLRLQLLSPQPHEAPTTLPITTTRIPQKSPLSSTADSLPNERPHKTRHLSHTPIMSSSSAQPVANGHAAGEVLRPRPRKPQHSQVSQLSVESNDADLLTPMSDGASLDRYLELPLCSQSHHSIVD